MQNIWPNECSLEAFNTPKFVAAKLLEIAFDETARPENVVVRLPSEK